MNNMSEDELKIKLKQVKDFKNKNEECYAEDLPFYMFWEKKDIEAIETILDSYQKEKEKNKKLQIRCKELIEEKQELNTAILYDNIHKDKIRAKIKELEEKPWLFNNDATLLKILKGLLEEG